MLAQLHVFTLYRRYSWIFWVKISSLLHTTLFTLSSFHNWPRWPAWYLRLAASYFCKIPSHLTDQSFGQYHVPAQWKASIILPNPRILNPQSLLPTRLFPLRLGPMRGGQEVGFPGTRYCGRGLGRGSELCKNEKCVGLKTHQKK